jgi:hypothetical protein
MTKDNNNNNNNNNQDGSNADDARRVIQAPSTIKLKSKQ